MPTSFTKSGRILKVNDAYAWMRECMKLTEKHGGFSQKNMAHMRGYQPFSVVARKLGYLVYVDQRFVWVSDAVTMVMAEMIIHEHHIRNEALTAAKAAARRELEINQRPQAPQTENVITLEDIRTHAPKPEPEPKKKSWWSWLFAPQTDPYEEFMQELMERFEDPFIELESKLDKINENQQKLADELIKMRNALASFLEYEEEET